MLQKFGDSLKGRKLVAYLILVPLALVFAAWGTVGIVEFDFAGAGSYAAKVNGQKIPAERVSDAWRDQQSEWQQRFGLEIPPEERTALQDALLEQFVRETLVQERTGSLGYRVAEQRVEEYILGLPAFQVDGQYNEQLALATLAQNGISTEAFRADIRSGLQNAELQRALQVSEFRTPLEIERAFRIEDEQREVRYALLPQDKYAAAVTVDDAAVQAYYAANAAQYQTTETVRLQYAELRLEQVASQVTVADTDLQDLYVNNRDRYIEPEKRRPSHILVNIEAGKDAEALKQAESILAEARQPGADFGALARRHSRDAGSAAQAGDLGWSERSAFVGPFSDAVFEMQEGEVRGPVKTEFGYHVIRLEGIQAGRSKSYEEAKPELEAQYRTDRAADLFGEREDLVQRSLEDPAVDIAAIAGQLGLTGGEVAEFARGSGGAPLGADAALEDLVFGDAVLNQRRIGGPLALGEDRFVIVKVLDHRKPTLRPLAEVRADVVAALRAERGAEAARAAADAAVRRLEAGEPLDAVARAAGVTAEPARFVGRADPSIPAQLSRVAFTLPRPQGQPVVRAVPLDMGGAAVLVLSQTRPAPVDASVGAEERAERVVRAAARSGSGDVSAYVAELRRGADVEKNLKALE